MINPFNVDDDNDSLFGGPNLSPERLNFVQSERAVGAEPDAYPELNIFSPVYQPMEPELETSQIQSSSIDLIPLPALKAP